VIRLPAERIAEEARATIAASGGGDHPVRAVSDSRQVERGDLFFGLVGEHDDGGRFAADALAAGAWGVIVRPERAAHLDPAAGWVLISNDPLRSLQRLARAWRRRLGCPVVGITGSTGKTSVKDIARAILPGRVHASPENFNTEVGLPLAILSAPEDAEALVLEMAMRGLGQIAELCEIAEPDVGAITNVGPVHLELLGTLEAIAEAKAEILQGLEGDGRGVIPADAEALEPHLRDSLETVTFGPGGDIFAREARVVDGRTEAIVVTPEGEQRFRFPFAEAHNLSNALCAIAIGVALGAPLEGLARRAPEIVFSRLRGESIELADGVVLINDCYNANPLSMRAALDHLRSLEPRGRRLAVLGGMAELGPDGPGYHREIGAHARELGVGPIVGVGELARDYAPDDWVPTPDAAVSLAERLLGPGDVVLVKGSRSVGLERFTDALAARRGS
jgi:UDP-N-acetylmuramoyl-tripeptide--D-alanyl-D-alanine ligase